jgi:hypothetical protein
MRRVRWLGPAPEEKRKGGVAIALARRMNFFGMIVANLHLTLRASRWAKTESIPLGDLELGWVVVIHVKMKMLI